MRIVFADESTLEVDRVSKTYDVLSSEIRLMVDMTSGVDPEEVFGKDFSSFTLKRGAFRDVVFEGYEVSDISEFYDSRSTNVSANLVKELS